MFGVVGARLSGGSVGALSGQAGGSSTLNGLELWAQGMVNKTNLSGSNGFDSDSTGLAFGGEKQVNDTIKIGLGYGYTQTDISTSSRETDVDTHTFFAYGEYKPSAHFYNAILSYAFADYDENAGINASGYDVDSLAMQVMTGYEFYSKDVDVTPQIGLRYVNVSKDGYTDTFGSKVSGDTSDIFTAVIGAKVGKKYILENKTSVRPEAKLSLTYDMINDDSNAVVSLVNGTTYTTTGKALDEFGVEIAAGVAMDLSQKTELSLNYEGEFRKDYDSHTGLLNFKYKF